MSTYDKVVETDRDFLWRFIIISLLWLLLFAAASVVLLIFQNQIGNLFF